jgi:phosphate ABC transporter phosphate-binding protein
MPRIRNSVRRTFLTLARAATALCLFLLSCCANTPAQTAQNLAQVKKVYVESIGQENGAAKLKDRLVEQLRQKAKLEIVSSPAQADAIVKGTGSLWIIGYYSTDPRSTSMFRQPVYRGFLSVEVLGKDNEPLWSFLVTPSKVASGDITKDLADHLVARLIDALEHAGGSTPGSPAVAPVGEVAISAAGSTFPAPIYLKWFESFEQRHPGVHLKYNPVGSEAGLQRLKDGKVDFAGSDLPLPEDKGSQSGKPYLQIATVVGAVVPVYNLKGIEQPLEFTPEVLAGIYSGKIKKWNDPAIRKSNHRANLPDAGIVVVHRSDGSGTTFVWSDFLSKTNPDWKASLGTGPELHWPVGNGVEGNEGVAALVADTPNSIGYVELVYALRHQLTFGAVRNAAGKFVLADLSSVGAASLNAQAANGPDFQGSITNAPGKDAYPLASFTWWIFPADLGADPKRAVLRELSQWVLSSGQKDCSALGYVPLPREMATRELETLSKIK